MLHHNPSVPSDVPTNGVLRMNNLQNRSSKSMEVYVQKRRQSILPGVSLRWAIRRLASLPYALWHRRSRARARARARLHACYYVRCQQLIAVSWHKPAPAGFSLCQLYLVVLRCAVCSTRYPTKSNCSTFPRVLLTWLGIPTAAGYDSICSGVRIYASALFKRLHPWLEFTPA